MLPKTSGRHRCLCPLLNFCVPRAGGVGAMSQRVDNSASGNESAGTPFSPVSAPLGLKEALCQLLLLPGASGVGHDLT